mmetsp:Transcript_32354/g.77656  ORF Transcript_32354/g.77656 Transcript_32354/m.77656 type:complete len:605 (-) Transcript_32354:115-1929(-)
MVKISKKSGHGGRGQKIKPARSNTPKKNRPAFSKSTSSTNPDRKLPEGMKAGHFRTKSTIKRLNMYRAKPDVAKMKEQKKKPVRIAPDRRWFGNTRVVTQDQLSKFRTELAKSVHDPFSVVLKRSKLPMALLKDPEKDARMNLLSIEPYHETFGPKSLRKKPKLQAEDLESLVARAEENDSKYEQNDKVDRDLLAVKQAKAVDKIVPEAVFNKGTSARIWRELYKVIDSSDIVLQVIDARDPMGTRCKQLEASLKKNHPNKHMILVFNKCDLVPAWVTKRWVRRLCTEYPCLAFHASVTNPFGKAALLNLIRQFAGLMKDRKHVQIGLIGYPNVGKSSVINALRRKKVCKSAPVPGETKIWQYVTLTKRIYLIDCPGIVPPSPSDYANDAAKVLKGVVRIERIKDPSLYCDEVLTRVKEQYLREKYKLGEQVKWKDTEEFLTHLALKFGKLLKKGEADIDCTAKIVLLDWQRGRLPFYTMPPAAPVEKDSDGEENPDKPSIVVKQSFAELAPALEFDEQDAHPIGEDPADNDDGEDVAAPGSDDEGEDAEGPSASSKAKGKKVKKTTKKGKKKGADDQVVVKPGKNQEKAGTVDWMAAISEFEA